MSAESILVLTLTTHLGWRDRDDLELLRHEPTGSVMGESG